MDEPFGAVDPLNREGLQAEFMKIQSDLKKTVVFVTHDLDEAIRLGDRIALMREGKIVQYDTPEEILAHPQNRFVSDFVGADRALKRLSRFPVSEFMKTPVVVKVSDDVDTFVAQIRKKADLDSSGSWIKMNGLSAPSILVMFTHPSAARRM